MQISKWSGFITDIYKLLAAQIALTGEVEMAQSNKNKSKSIRSTANITEGNGGNQPNPITAIEPNINDLENYSIGIKEKTDENAPSDSVEELNFIKVFFFISRILSFFRV